MNFAQYRGGVSNNAAETRLVCQLLLKKRQNRCPSRLGAENRVSMQSPGKTG
jgi:hypothetical protein